VPELLLLVLLLLLWQQPQQCHQDNLHDAGNVGYALS